MASWFATPTAWIGSSAKRAASTRKCTGCIARRPRCASFRSQRRTASRRQGPATGVAGPSALAMPDLSCPGCGRGMRSLALPREPLAPVTVDVCDDCQALWLDATESQQLTPGAVIALFRAIGSSRPTHRDAYPALLPCPRCTTPLTLTQDLQHTTRFTYYRCRYGHGRFTPYVQFLREKNFIRAPDP